MPRASALLQRVLTRSVSVRENICSWQETRISSNYRYEWILGREAEPQRAGCWARVGRRSPAERRRRSPVSCVSPPAFCLLGFGVTPLLCFPGAVRHQQDSC